MVIKKWVELLLSRRDDEVFILNGYAGTGKTTVLSALVATLKELGLLFRQMAPTGRAAKVMSRLTGLPAYTIHRTIYRQKSYAQANCFELGEGLHPGTIFIVDEASMIANDGMSSEQAICSMTSCITCSPSQGASSFSRATRHSSRQWERQGRRPWRKSG